MRQRNFVFDPKTGVIYDYKFTQDTSLANQISNLRETKLFNNTPIGTTSIIVEIHP